MKILHTADLHIGQIIYQAYNRQEEHDHFFKQLEKWCVDEKPDALLVSGDIFDIKQPSSATQKAFVDYFLNIHKKCPNMTIVLAAGNHDSVSRIEAEQKLWKLANTHLISTAPTQEIAGSKLNWQDDYIITLECGFIIALPYMIGEKQELVQSILDYVADRNTSNKPVFMMAHLAVTGLDAEGHEIGNLKTQEIGTLGTGYDYLALGHIHKPQTINHPQNKLEKEVLYPSGVIRYSGSALHVSCDENYPHTVSIVEATQRGGDVKVRELRIDELIHFYTLPLDGTSFQSEAEALVGVKDFVASHDKGYIRLRIAYNADITPNFMQKVYNIIEEYKYVRYNPKIIWTGKQENNNNSENKSTFELAELQQMENPIDFVKKTMDKYPQLQKYSIEDIFEEIKKEMTLLEENETEKSTTTKKKTQTK